MKKTIIRLSTCILISAMIWFISTWKLFICVATWVILLPICMGLIGLFSGISIKKYWFMPLMQPLFFLADYWLLTQQFGDEGVGSPTFPMSKAISYLEIFIPFRTFRDMFTSDMIITYMLLYLMIALTAMLFSALIVRLLKRKKVTA